MKTRSSARNSTISVKSKTPSKLKNKDNVRHRNTKSDDKPLACNSKTDAVNSTKQSQNEITKKSSNSSVEKKLQLEDISEVTLKKLCLKLSSKDNSNLYGFEHEVNFIENVLKNFFENNDSNTLLVCGAKGVGKSSLVNHCLSRYKCEDYAHQIIRLHGLLHSAELICIRYVSSLLNIEATDFPMFVSSLRDFCEKTKVIFILESFDIFCRKHQTLIYNLFDISQKTGNICVIGLTTRLDCVELLEKRVKSRMNHRILNIHSPFKSQEDYLNFAAFLLDGKIKILSPLKDLLIQQYSMNTSIRSLKHCLITFLLDASQKQREKEKSKDAKVNAICSLSYLNLSVLFLAFKYTQSNNTETFSYGSLLPLLPEIPTQFNVSKKLLMKAIDELIEYGLIVKSASVRTRLYLTEWTILSLAIDEIHIKEVLTKKENNLPLNVNRLLTTLQ